VSEVLYAVRVKRVGERGTRQRGQERGRVEKGERVGRRWRGGFGWGTCLRV
jgi:hypothetical protein